MLTLQTFLATLAAACGLISIAVGVGGAAEAKPNIIVIVADDFGYECVTANGGQSYQTPNIDKLAASGLRFEHCHVQPLCTPTRVQLMTGMYNVRNYLNFGTLPRTETTFAHLLKRAGYSTGICGKWQLGREQDSPQHFGFEESCLWQHTRRPPRYANPGLEYNGVARDFSKGEYGPKLLSDFALDFITRHKEQPFFLYYPMTLTHDPFQPTPDSPDWDPKAVGENVNRNVKHFADMTAYMDKMVGQLMTKLEELGIRDNTLVLFLGDNGTGRSVTSRFRGTDYRGGNGTTTQRGTHVPLIVSWPAVMRAGRVNRDLISSVDILPTICEAAGVPAPANTDGASFLPQLRGERGTPREWLYCWYSPRQQADLTVKEFAFDLQHKFYRTGEFFDLATDPFEQRPLQRDALSGEAANAASRLQRCSINSPTHAPWSSTARLSQPNAERRASKRSEVSMTFSNQNLQTLCRRCDLRFLLLTGLWMAATLGDTSLRAADKPNVLFIAIDDLNHWVGHLGRHPQAKTPKIDRFAKQGVTFTRAYCTAPACNPSRASLMSGQRPSTTGCYLNGQNWRPGISEDKLLNTHFSRAGYRVYGAGKIYHGAGDRGGEWSDYFPGKGNTQRHPDAKDTGVGGIQFYPLANSDEEMPDYSVVSYGLEKLKEKSDKPFFLAVGLVKPHMPFSVPKKWFDLFPLDSIELPPYREDDLSDVPSAGVKMAGPQGDHAKIVASGRWKEAVQAYLATIAFCDSQVGRLLDGLEKSPHRDNTIVCLWSDHGWSLGEKSHWRKFALWEEPTRTVFVWRVPGVTQPGGVCGRTVDYSGVYPTLCELTGLPLPKHLDGRSLAPLLRDPKSAWDTPAITTHGLKNHSVRTEGWRYIRYANGDEELYDEAADPLEYANLANKSEHAARKSELAKWLPKSDTASLPSADSGGAKKKAKAKQRP